MTPVRATLIHAGMPDRMADRWAPRIERALEGDGSWDAPAAEPVPPRTCARYWGSDGTMCATHNGRFATDLTNRCNRAAAEPVPLTLDELSMAKAVHEAFHSYALPTLTCMTKHRVKARRILAALASPDKGEPR